MAQGLEYGGAVTFVTEGEPVGVTDMRVFDSGLS